MVFFLFKQAEMLNRQENRDLKLVNDGKDSGKSKMVLVKLGNGYKVELLIFKFLRADDLQYGE